MLSIKAMSLESERYYTGLAREDYYLKGGEPPGRWLGSGAERLGYTGQVTKDDLKGLFHGFDRNGIALVQNAGVTDGKGRRKPGWDLVFNAPKSVSVLWALADQDTQHQIQEAHFAAIRKAIQYLEEEVAKSRVGKGGFEQTRAELVVALFEHGTSRALEPHLHGHALVLNVGTRPDHPDGGTGSLVSKPIYNHKMAAGALYRCELGYGLRKRLALPLERSRFSFDIRGVPKALMRFFSTRRKELKEELDARGLETASAAAFVALITRKVKDLIPARKDLFKSWRKEGEKHWFTQQQIDFLKGKSPPPKSHAKALTEAITEGLDVVLSKHSHFAKRDFLRYAAQAAQDKGIPVDSLRKAVDRRLKSSPDIVNLGVRNGEKRYTTRQVVQLEKEMLDAADRLFERDVPGLRDNTVAKTITKKRKFKTTDGKTAKGTLSLEQGYGLAYLTQGKGAIKSLIGFAGTGKTTTLTALRECCQRDGIKIIGACLSGKAARDLERDTGIPSDTLAMRLIQLYPSKWHLWKHEMKQWYRALRKWPTSRPDTLRITNKTFFVLDEASMVPTMEMYLLLQAIDKGGGRLALVGDTGQIQAIEAGGALEAITKRFGAFDLQQITRQREEWQRNAVRQLSRGEAEDVLKTFALRGYLTVDSTDKRRERSLINDWARGGGIEEPQRHVICVSTNEQVDRFNQLAQQERARKHQLDLSSSITIGDETFHRGDVVRFTKRSKRFGVENGDVGTIEEIKPHLGLTREISVRIKGNKHPARIPVKSRLGPLAGPVYEGLRLGYVNTTHSLQGATVANNYVVLGGTMTDREMTYVQASRAQVSTRLYTLEDEAGEHLTDLARNGQTVTRQPEELESELARQVAKSHKKTLALEVAPEFWSDDLERGFQEHDQERDIEQALERLEQELSIDPADDIAQALDQLEQEPFTQAPTRHKSPPDVDR